MSKPKIAIIVQARLSSSRLPSKVLIRPPGYSLSILEIGFQRLSRSQYAENLVYAIPYDEPILSDFLRSRGINYFLGHPTDVMKRYLDCASDCKADVIVRLTADCPLVDPLMVDSFIDHYLSQLSAFPQESYLSNYTPPETSSYCNGSDIEIFSAHSLRKFYLTNPTANYREHVTFQFWDQLYPVNHLHMHYMGDDDLSRMRITVDYSDDIDVIASLASVLDLKTCSFDDIVHNYFSKCLFNVNGSYDSRAGWQQL